MVPSGVQESLLLLLLYCCFKRSAFTLGLWRRRTHLHFSQRLDRALTRAFSTLWRPKYTCKHLGTTAKSFLRSKIKNTRLLEWKHTESPESSSKNILSLECDTICLLLYCYIYRSTSHCTHMFTWLQMPNYTATSPHISNEINYFSYWLIVTIMELPSITVLFFRSMSSAVISPNGLAGAAVIGAFVLPVS